MVRTATTADISIIQHLACSIWPVAYASILSPGQLGYMLHRMYSQQTLLQQMTKEAHQFFIALAGATPIGFTGISQAAHPALNNGENLWKLHKLYVLPAAQQSGIGKQLLEHSIDYIQSQGGNYIILNVNRRNPAYRYYLKQGFQILESGDFDIGAGFFMNDYVMGKPLLPGNQPWKLSK